MQQIVSRFAYIYNMMRSKRVHFICVRGFQTTCVSMFIANNFSTFLLIMIVVFSVLF